MEKIKIISADLDIAHEIRILHSEICTSARTTIDKAIRIGELLTQQKELIDPGDWLLWLQSNVGFSRQTADNYRRIYERREEIKMLNFGNLSAVYQLLANNNSRHSEKKKRKQEKRERHAAIDIDPEWALHCCDLREAPIQPEIVDAILTDPPYPKEFLSCFESLSECAAKWLKPGGSLLVMSGQIYFPEVLKRLCSQSDLSYHWLVSYLTPGGQSVQIFPRSVNTFWKPVVWLVKGKYFGDWIGDVTRSEINDNDKRFHDWGQSESGMADLITRFTLPGQLIVDPFCGGGTTGVVALELGRRFLGIDKDPQAIKTTKERLEELF